MSDPFLPNEKIIKHEDVPQLLQDSKGTLLASPDGLEPENIYFGWDHKTHSWCQFWRKDDGSFSFNGWLRDASMEMIFQMEDWRFEPITPESDYILPIIEN